MAVILTFAGIIFITRDDMKSILVLKGSRGEAG
jgi:hypothetical protein